MRDEQLNLALERCLNDEISERTKELEECKKVAFEIWDKILEIHENISPKTMKVYTSGLKIILEYDSRDGENDIISFPYSHPKILKFISIIAEHSDIKGKMFGQSDGLSFIFSYK